MNENQVGGGVEPQPPGRRPGAQQVVEQLNLIGQMSVAVLGWQEASNELIGGQMKASILPHARPNGRSSESAMVTTARIRPTSAARAWRPWLVIR